MKILAVSDEISPKFWDHFQKDSLLGYDLIISCGDLKAEYLSFLVTMARCPVLYVHGNHDERYSYEPPLGCDCIEDKIVEFNGIKILGLGGSYRYHPGSWQYTEKEMRRRIRTLRYQLWRTGGVDVVVSHAPIEGVGDGQDIAHKGFAAFRELVEKYKPKYWLHGHMHLNYGQDKIRERVLGETKVINAYGYAELEIAEKEHDGKMHNQLRWRNGKPKYNDDGI